MVEREIVSACKMILHEKISMVEDTADVLDSVFFKLHFCWYLIEKQFEELFEDLY